MSDTLFARIQLRAYYAAQNDDYRQSPEHYWLAAERTEWALIERAELEATERACTDKRKRSEAAKRGAATRKRNRDAELARKAILLREAENTSRHPDARAAYREMADKIS